MEPLFEPEETSERMEMQKATKEKLAKIEAEKIRLMHELQEIATEQKGRVSGMRALEREQREILKEVEEYTVPEDQELTQEDVERWCQSAPWNMAHTMPANPHNYFARKKVRQPEMYERIVGYVLKNGYPQRYGSATYTVLDVELNDGVWFLWPMTDDPKRSEVLNLKPDAMRPDEE